MSDPAEAVASAPAAVGDDLRLGEFAGDYERWESGLPGLLNRLEVPARGVVQVGAHTGQEVAALARCGFGRLVMMEPNPDHIPELSGRLRAHLGAGDVPADEDGLLPWEIVRAAAGRERGRAVLHVTEYDQQSSLLAPVTPLTVTRRDITPVIPVREVQRGCNVLVVDVQGAELDVLIGTDLGRLDLAVVEGSTGARYRGGATLSAISDYMHAHGWRPVASWPHARPGVVDVAWLAPLAGSTPLAAS